MNFSNKKTERFFEAFTELDDDLIENAIPKEQDYDIVKPAMKIHSWKPWVAGAAVAAAAVGVAFAGMKLFGSNGKPGFAPGTQSEIYSDASVDNYNYAPFLADWRVYDTPEELVDAAQIIFEGKVTDISFALLDNMTMRERDDDFYEMCDLFTIYEVESNGGYKNVDYCNLRFAVRGGLKGYKVEEQLALSEKLGDNAIPVMEHHPEINIGEEYMFLLAGAPYDFDAIPFIINNTQTAFPLSDPNYRDEFCHASADDIINCVNSDHHSNHHCDATVYYEGQLISLDKDHTIILKQAVQDAIADDCTPGLQLQTVISQDKIDEYRKDGIAIDIVFDDDGDIAALNPTAQTTCHATILVGKNDKPSYITYWYHAENDSGSYNDFDGGCYYLTKKSYNMMDLAIFSGLGVHWAPNLSNSLYASECVFDYFYQDNMEWDKTKEFTLPEYPNAKFKWSSEKITAVKNGNETELFSGMPVWSVYLADLNGDGKREICSTVSMGSGIVDNRIYAYDYANGKLYELQDRLMSDYYLKLQDGELMYVQQPQNGSEEVTKKLLLGVMTEVPFTAWNQPDTTSHHEEETSHHDEPEHTTVSPTPTVTTGTHHDEHDETHH